MWLLIAFNNHPIPYLPLKLMAEGSDLYADWNHQKTLHPKVTCIYFIGISSLTKALFKLMTTGETEVIHLFSMEFILASNFILFWSKIFTFWIILWNNLYSSSTSHMVLSVLGTVQNNTIHYERVIPLKVTLNWQSRHLSTYIFKLLKKLSIYLGLKDTKLF